MPVTTSRVSGPPLTVMAFVDAGYLTAGARKYFNLQGPVRLNGEALEMWSQYAWADTRPTRTLRTYIYDGALPAEAEGFAEQRAYFDQLAGQRGIRLRLGHLAERQAGSPRARFEQKGVDTLLVLDLLRMAQQGAFDIAIIIAGDRDLAEALRVIADDYARRVLLYEVPGSEPHKELRHVADDFGTLDVHELARMVGHTTEAAT